MEMRRGRRPSRSAVARFSLQPRCRPAGSARGVPVGSTANRDLGMTEPPRSTAGARTSHARCRVGLCGWISPAIGLALAQAGPTASSGGCCAGAGFRADPPDHVVWDAWRHRCGRRTRIEEREDRKVPLRKNFDTHLRLGFHGGMRAFLSRMRVPPRPCLRTVRLGDWDYSGAWARRPAGSRPSGGAERLRENYEIGVSAVQGTLAGSGGYRVAITAGKRGPPPEGRRPGAERVARKLRAPRSNPEQGGMPDRAKTRPDQARSVGRLSCAGVCGRLGWGHRPP